MACIVTATMTLQQDTVHVWYADGGKADVARAKLLKSELIRDSTGIEQAAERHEYGACFTVAAPEGYLETWLESFQWLERANTPRSRSTCTLAQTRAEKVLEFLKAADFFKDTESRSTFCHILGVRLLAACTVRQDDAEVHLSLSATSTEQLVQVLESLPSGLLLSILLASGAPLCHLLNTLPHHLHSAVVETSFPSLLQNSSLTLDCDHLQLDHAAVVLQEACCSLNGPMRALEVYNVLVDDYNEAGEPLVHRSFWLQLSEACLRSASVHLTLHVSSFFEEPPEHLQSVVRALETSNALTSASISISVASNCFTVFDVEPFVPVNKCLCSISINVKEGCVGPSTMAAEFPVTLGRMKLLTSLELTGNVRTFEEVTSALQSLPSLQNLCLQNHLDPFRRTITADYSECLYVSASALKLTRLALSGRYGSDMCQLQILRHIRCLDLSKVGLGGVGDAESLALSLRQMQRLEHLSLHLLANDMVAMLDPLLEALEDAGTAHSLHSLRLVLPECVNLPLVGKAICEQMQRIPKLKTLRTDMSAYDGVGDLPLLTEFQGMLSSLSCLEITGKSFTTTYFCNNPKASRRLLLALGMLRDLEQLTLHVHVSTDPETQATVPDCILQLQQLCNVNITKQMLLLGAEALSGLPCLTQLIVHNMGPRLSIEPAQQLQRTDVQAALAAMKHLESLQLHDVLDAPDYELTVGVSSLRQLKYLSIHSCTYLPRYLILSIAGLTQLVELQLMGGLHCFGDSTTVPAAGTYAVSHVPGISHADIFDVLRSLTSLARLSLNWYPFDQAGSEVFAVLTRLTSLSVCRPTNILEHDDFLVHCSENAQTLLRSLPKLRISSCTPHQITGRAAIMCGQ